MILNPNKTKALVVSRSRTVNPPHGDLVLSGVSICASPNLDILGVKFDRRSPSKTMCVALSRVSLIELVFWGCEACLRRHICVASLLLCIYSPNPCVLFSGVGVCCCHLQHLERQVYLMTRLCPDQSVLSLCHRGDDSALCMLYKVNSDSNIVQWASFCSVRVWHTRAEAASHPLEFWRIKVYSTLRLKIYKVFPSGPDSSVEWPSHTVFDAVTFDWFEEKRHSLVASLSFVFQLSVAEVVVGLRKKNYKQFSFSHSGCVCGFMNK